MSDITGTSGDEVNREKHASPIAVKEKCVHYVAVGSPLTFCGIDMRGRNFWESSTPPLPDELAKALFQLPLCKRCAKAHLKQTELEMGLDDRTWENTP